MALTLKGTTGSVSSSDLVRDGGAREIGGAFVTTDRAVELIMAARERQQQERPAVRRVLMRDVLEVLHADGVLPAPSLRAGQEVAKVWHFRTAGLFARTAKWGERMDRGPMRDEASPGLVLACERFNIWAEWAGKERVNPRVTLVDLTLDVAVDGMGMRQVAEHRGCHHRRSLKLIQLSLWHYADLAGWHVGDRVQNVA